MPSNPKGTTVETPNVVIENPKVRKVLGLALYIIGVVAGLAAFVLSGIALPFDVDFWVAKVTGAVAILSGAFGLGVTLPNIPKGDGQAYRYPVTDADGNVIAYDLHPASYYEGAEDEV